MPHHIPDYHLIDLLTGTSHGGYASLEAARAMARHLGLTAWDIWHRNVRVELHDPYPADPIEIDDRLTDFLVARIGVLQDALLSAPRAEA
jgi:hypothetical protein